MASGFEIRVNGEVVWTTEQKVLSVEASTARGAAADVKAEDLNFIDLVVTARSDYNKHLSIVDEENLQKRRDEIKDNKISATTAASGKSVVVKADKK